MAKNCDAHPDSPAVAECGACAKPVCLLCVEEAPEGAFCSASCVEARRLQLRAQAAVAADPAGSCANHPDSPATARCKVCDKAVCLLCLVDSPEGSFCSRKCLDVVSEVKGWVDDPSVVLKPDEAPPPPPPAPLPPPPVPEFVPRARPREPKSVATPPARKPAGAGRAVALALAAVALVAVGATAVVLTLRDPGEPAVARSQPTPPEPAPEPEPPKPEPAEPAPPPKPAPVVEPEPPKPALVARPEPARSGPSRHLARAADPWREVKPGAWFRVKTVEAGREGYRDVGLRERGAWYVVLATQLRGEKTGDERHRWTGPGEARSAGELKLERPEATLDLELATLRGRESEVLWVVREGRHAGVVVKTEAAGLRVRILKAGPETVTVKGREFDCLRVETDEGGATVVRWLSAELPLAALKTERAGATETLVDFGGDWSERPSFPGAPTPASKAEPVQPPPLPVAKPDPPKEGPAERAKLKLAEAASRIREATPIYRDVATDPLPSQPAELRALKARAESALRMFREARALYLEARPASDDPAILDRRISQVDSFLTALAARMARIEAGLR